MHSQNQDMFVELIPDRTNYSSCQIEDLLFVRSVLFFDGLVIIWVYICFFSLVARTATLGNSGNLHKSKMAAIDSGWRTILQLVNSE